MFGWVTKAATALFGKSSDGKGIVSEVSDAVDRWHPSAQTKFENSLEENRLSEQSQDSARKMVFTSHESKFDILIDGLNRLPRPMFAFWAFGVLVGWWPAPDFQLIDPLTLKLILSVFGFYFGMRGLTKDIMPALARLINTVKK